MAEIRGLSGRKPVQQPDQPGVWEQMFANLISGVVSGGAKTAMDTYAQTEYLMPAEAAIEDEAAYNKMAREGFMKTGQQWPSFQEYKEKGLPEGWGEVEGFSSGGLIGLEGQAKSEAAIRVEEAKAEAQRKQQHEQDASRAETNYAKAVEGLSSSSTAHQKALSVAEVTSGSNSQTVKKRLQSQTDFLNKLLEGRKEFIAWARDPAHAPYVEELVKQNPQYASMYYDTLNGKSLNEGARSLGNTRTNAKQWRSQKITPAQLNELKEIDRFMNKQSWNLGILKLQVLAKQIENHYISAGHVKLDEQGKPLLVNGRPQLNDQKQAHMDSMHGAIVHQAVTQRLNEYIAGGGDVSEEGLARFYQSFSPGVHDVIRKLHRRSPNLHFFHKSVNPHIQHYLKWINSPPSDETSHFDAVNNPNGALQRLASSSRSDRKLGDDWVRHDELSAQQVAEIGRNMSVDSQYLLAAVGGQSTGEVSDEQKIRNSWNIGANRGDDRYSEEGLRKRYGATQPYFENPMDPLESVKVISESIIQDTPEISLGHIAGIRRYVGRFEDARVKLIQQAINVNSKPVKALAAVLGITDATAAYTMSQGILKSQLPPGTDIDTTRASAQRVLEQIVGNSGALNEQIKTRMDKDPGFKEKVLDNIEAIFTGTPTGSALRRNLVPGVLRIKAKPWPGKTAAPEGATFLDQKPEQGEEIITLEEVDSYANQEVMKHLLWMESSDSSKGFQGGNVAIARGLLSDLRSPLQEKRLSAKRRVAKLAEFVGLKAMDAIGMNSKTGELEIDLERYKSIIHRLLGSPDGPLRMDTDDPFKGIRR